MLPGKARADPEWLQARVPGIDAKVLGPVRKRADVLSMLHS